MTTHLMSQPERKNIGTSPTKHWMPMLSPRRRVIQCSVSESASRGPHVSLVTRSRDDSEARSERYQGRYTQIRLVSTPHSTHLILLVTTLQ